MKVILTIFLLLISFCVIAQEPAIDNFLTFINTLNARIGILEKKTTEPDIKIITDLQNQFKNVQRSFDDKMKAVNKLFDDYNAKAKAKPSIDSAAFSNMYQGDLAGLRKQYQTDLSVFKSQNDAALKKLSDSLTYYQQSKTFRFVLVDSALKK